MKPQFALLLLWGALRGQWRFTAWFAGAGLVFATLSVAIFGVDNHLDYLRLLSYLSRHGESLILNQSFNGLLHRLLHNGAVVFEDYARLGPGEWVPPYNLWVHVGTLASTLVIVGFALFWRRREHMHDSLGDLMIAALSFTIASPIAWTHHYGVLLPMFAVALPAVLASSRLGAGAVVALAIAYLLTGNFFKETERFAETPFNFLISYLYFGGLLLLWQLYRVRHAASVDDHVPQERAAAVQHTPFA
jgi:RsiW-degrading membrane proteinase PrsW (M82 family)